VISRTSSPLCRIPLIREGGERKNEEEEMCVVAVSCLLFAFNPICVCAATRVLGDRPMCCAVFVRLRGKLPVRQTKTKTTTIIIIHQRERERAQQKYNVYDCTTHHCAYAIRVRLLCISLLLPSSPFSSFSFFPSSHPCTHMLGANCAVPAFKYCFRSRVSL
jgi:hypothetical protein